MRQFYYTRKEPSPVQIEGQETKYKEYTDSFTIDLVIRSMELEDGRRVVLLNDMHERPQDVPVKDKKGAITYKRERNVFQSEIYLEVDDAKRFVSLGL